MTHSPVNPKKPTQSTLQFQQASTSKSGPKVQSTPRVKATPKGKKAPVQQSEDSSDDSGSEEDVEEPRSRKNKNQPPASTAPKPGSKPMPTPVRKSAPKPAPSVEEEEEEGEETDAPPKRSNKCKPAADEDVESVVSLDADEVAKTKKKVPYPESKMNERKTCTKALWRAVQSDVERFMPAAKRAQKDKVWVATLAKAIWPRRHQARVKPMNIGRVMMFVAFGLAVYRGKKKLMRGAINELLRHKNYLCPGRLTYNTNSGSFKYEVEDRNKEYALEVIIQIISTSWMGQADPMKDDKGLKLPGFEFEEELFPVARFKCANADPDEIAREIPIPMMAYAASSLERALQEWDSGTHRNIKVEYKNIKRPIYLKHVQKLNEKGERKQLILLQHIYTAARNWSSAIVIDDSESEMEEIDADQYDALFE
ncbi:hypothetical protein PENSPDRAFT_671547 [Peniophora sp. CONT]|nr:hypothetical protein PENSPDRAFT_671547 [Peniophora sp. CONT]